MCMVKKYVVSIIAEYCLKLKILYSSRALLGGLFCISFVKGVFKLVAQFHVEF